MSVALLLALVGLAAGAQGIRIVGREYNQTLLQSDGGARGHIVPALGGLLYRKYSHYRLYIMSAGESISHQMEGLLDTPVYDILMDPSGLVWVATRQGLFQYSPKTGKITNPGVTSLHAVRLAASAEGALFVVDHATRALYEVRGQGLVPVPGVQDWCLAFSREGHLFYAAWGGSVLYRRAGGPTGEQRAVAGIPTSGWTQLLEMDRRDDMLYVCHHQGLYTVPSGSITAARVEGVAAPVFGLGFAPNGDVYIGREHELLKLTLLPDPSVDPTPPLPSAEKPPVELDGKLQLIMEGITSDLAGQIKAAESKLSRKIDEKLLEVTSHISSAMDDVQKAVASSRGECTRLREGTEEKLEVLERALYRLQDRPPARGATPAE